MKIEHVLLRFTCIFSEFFSPMPWILGKTPKTTSRISRCQGDGVLTGVAGLEKTAARTFLVAQNVTLQFARVYFVPLFPLAPHYLLEIEDEGERTTLKP